MPTRRHQWQSPIRSQRLDEQGSHSLVRQLIGAQMQRGQKGRLAGEQRHKELGAAAVAKFEARHVQNSERRLARPMNVLENYDYAGNLRAIRGNRRDYL